VTAPAAADERHLGRAIALARAARESGNHPFGALLVDGEGLVVFEAENTVLTGRDCTNHAELNLVRLASVDLDERTLGSHTLYASTEPCAMCAGAIYWSGIGRVVYGLSGAALASMVEGGEELELKLPCREVFARGGRPVEVSGPHLEERARSVHEGFWE
jgi:tRNA(Arg) A34 adenosine deaminase TadA